MESLGLRILPGLGLLDRRRLGLGHDLAGRVGHDVLGGLGDGLAGGRVGDGGQAAGEDGRAMVEGMEAGRCSCAPRSQTGERAGGSHRGGRCVCVCLCVCGEELGAGTAATSSGGFEEDDEEEVEASVMEFAATTSARH